MANSVTEEYMQIPAVTRAYTTACVLTTAAVVSKPSYKTMLPDTGLTLRDKYRIVTY